MTDEQQQQQVESSFNMHEYQVNRRYMCWAALVMMLLTTAGTLYDPARMAAAESILMTQYLALSGLVAAYFGFGNSKR